MSASALGGIRFGNFVLLRRIARGGMAEVFLAQQKGLEGFDRRVAVKRILPHLADAPDFVKMFLGEARLAAQLSHPNIVHIYDFGKVDTDYFIAMEFVDGVHAGQLFKHADKEKMPPTMVARIGADAATALHYAHELRNQSGKPYGLVHRDVSPANIMVSFDGVVKLCDFGIAKAAALGDQLTNPGQVKGKYAYMSPEQTIASPLDGRSDVFSLGIVMWELLTGKTIVGRGDAVEAMRAIRDGKLPSITQAAPGIPPALAKAVTWAMQTRREIRATAMDLAQALESFIKSSPELATPMQLGAWVRQRFVREGTGQHVAIPGVSVGTRVRPGTLIAADTVDSPGTAVSEGTQAGTVTPPSSLIAASRITDPRASDEMDHAETIDIGSVEMMSDARDAAGEATVLEPNARAAVATTERDEERDLLDPNDTVDETVMRSGAFRAPVGGAAGLPTIVEARAIVEARVTEPRPPATPASVDTTAGMRRRGPRPALAIGGLVLLAILSFVIALAAKSCGASGAAKVASKDAAVRAPDAAALAMVDAASVLAVMDAAEPGAGAGAPADARGPTIRVDAADEVTLLDVRTKPAGGSVRVNGEVRAEPAKFALAPGTYTIVAELDGYAPEKRSVELLKGVDLVQEIAFTRRLSTGTRPTAPPTGKLTARTTPYSVVFLGGKRLGETPFAELELPVGVHLLTFKHPQRSPVTRRVTITANKTTKISLTLP